MDRHDRQSRLAEVGSAGQARIDAATVEVRLDGLAAEIATRYLAGAGVGRLRVRDRALADVATSIDPGVRVEVGGSRPLHDDDAWAGVGAPTVAADARDDAARDLRAPEAREAARGAREALRVLRSLIEGAS
jgi:molybdopterin/thiamine biosynthesis adenylyltransferase